MWLPLRWKIISCKYIPTKILKKMKTQKSKGIPDKDFLRKYKKEELETQIAELS